MERIKEQGFESKVLGIFTWIDCACRPLTTDELTEILTVSFKEDPDKSVPLNWQEWLDMCESLVVITEDKTVLFAHRTVSEFLRSQYGSHVYSSIWIAKACLRYLGLDVFSEVGVDEESLKGRTKKHMFSGYAAEFWGNHIKDAEYDVGVQNLVYEVFADESRRTAIRQMEQYVKSGFEEANIEPLLLVMAEKGLSHLCQKILSEIQAETRYYLMLLEADHKYGRTAERAECHE